MSEGPAYPEVTMSQRALDALIGKEVAQAAARLAVRWHDDAHPPTSPGLYYHETCNQFGEPRPGFYLWEEGKPPQFPGGPWKMFGPIVGAMQLWPTVPVTGRE